MISLQFLNAGAFNSPHTAGNWRGAVSPFTSSVQCYLHTVFSQGIFLSSDLRFAPFEPKVFLSCSVEYHGMCPVNNG